jgi:hypothetical protein
LPGHVYTSWALCARTGGSCTAPWRVRTQSELLILTPKDFFQGAQEFLVQRGCQVGAQQFH